MGMQEEFLYFIKPVMMFCISHHLTMCPSGKLDESILSMHHSFNLSCRFHSFFSNWLFENSAGFKQEKSFLGILF